MAWLFTPMATRSALTALSDSETLGSGCGAATLDGCCSTDNGLRRAGILCRGAQGGVLSGALKASLVDVTHDVSPFDSSHGAFVLRQIWTWFPQDTVYLTVVDPGVVTNRRIPIEGAVHPVRELRFIGGRSESGQGQ
jgi:hypothetical protein